MKKYLVKNCESVKDFAGDFIGMIFKGEETNRGKYNQVKLHTLDGDLYFELDEVEEVAEESNLNKVYEKCEEILNAMESKESRLKELKGFISGVEMFISIDNLDKITRQFELMIKY